MKRLPIIFILFLLIIVLPLPAEDTEPEEPDLVLPPMVLEVEELTVEEVQAVIPEDGEVNLSLVATELPEPEDIPLSREAFDLTLPAEGTGDAGIGISSSDFFSMSTIGLGSRAHLIGDIELFLLGVDPRAYLHFRHDGMDGFGAHAAGEGYDTRSELFEGTLSLNPGSLQVNGSGSFSEEEFGLQDKIGTTGYSAVLNRDIRAFIDIDAPVTERFSASGAIDMVVSDVVLAGDVPVGGTELDAGASAAANYTVKYLNLGAHGGYRFLNWLESSRPAHILKAGLSVESDFPFALDLGGDVDILWVPGMSPAFPFSVSAVGYLGGTMTIRAAGGYEWDVPSYANLRERVTLIDFFDSRGALTGYNLESGWFAEAEIRYEPSDRFGLEAGCSYRNASSRFQPTALSNRGLFAYTYTAVESVMIETSLNWQVAEPVSVGFGLSALVYGSDVTLPDFEATGTLELLAPEGAYGLSAEGSYVIYDSGLVPVQPIPMFSLGGFLKLGDGVSFSLNAEDIISAFSSSPSYDWDGYERPGFNMVFKTNLSL